MKTPAIQSATAPLKLSSLIAGESVAGEGPPLESFEPWTGALVAHGNAVSEDDLGRAIDAAGSAEQAFADRGWMQRGELLHEAARIVRLRAEELSVLVAREVGKPLAEAQAEVNRTARVFEFYAAAAARAKGSLIPSSEAGVAILTRRRPIGTVAVITPWNFPLVVPAWKIAPALICGNPVVWKPASAAPACADALASCLRDAGLPAGAISLVLGSGAAMEPLLNGPVAAVSFTGSTGVGHAIRERVAPRGVRVQLELGGNNVAVVLDGAAEGAAEKIARAAYGFAGQKCTATSLVLATPGIRDELEKRLIEVTERVAWGDPFEPGVWGGPVIDRSSADEISEVIAAVAKDGGEVVAQTACEDRPTVVPPTLIRAADRSTRTARQEVFGPVLTLLDAHEPEELIKTANATEYGLVASIFGKDIDAVRGLVNRLEVGLIAINRGSTGLEVQAPAAGWKASGGGDPEQGEEALRFFTEHQTIYWKSDSEYGEFP